MAEICIASAMAGPLRIERSSSGLESHGRRASMLQPREREKMIYRAYVRNGYTMKEIADCLGVHDITSSRAVNRMENPKK